MSARTRLLPRVSAGESALALALALVGAAGALPALAGAGAAQSALPMLAWMALLALPLGLFAGASGSRLWPVGLAVPAAWLGLFAGVAAAAEPPLPAPLSAAAAVAGLYLAGDGIGALARGRAWSGASLALALACLLAAAPAGLWLAPAPWPPPVAARLLDLSPLALVAECAGLDWMRHPSVYAPVGSDSIGPALRSAWRGELAGPTALLLGCLASLLGRAGAATRAADPHPGP